MHIYLFGLILIARSLGNASAVPMQDVPLQGEYLSP